MSNFRAFIFVSPREAVQNQPRLEIDKSLIEVNNNPAKIHMLQVSNRNSRKRYQICSMFAMKTPGRHQRRSGVFIVNFEHISNILGLCLLLLYRFFEEVNVCCKNPFINVPMNAFKVNVKDTILNFFKYCHFCRVKKYLQATRSIISNNIHANVTW